ncbi:MAG: radical SAM protein [Candidatus Omnitrophota bacterium]
MKIRLIQPAHLDLNGKPIKYKKLFLPTLALPTVAGLTPGSVEVGITDEYVQDINFDEDADLIGITAHTPQAPRAYQISEEFRKRGKKTIMGGIHVSACPDEALKYCDCVVVGEAEDLWEDVIRDAEHNRLKNRYEAKARPDLSKLVIPRFDLLDFDNYVIPPFAKTPLIPVQATRGCPHYCDFCSVTPLLGHSIRKKPIAHVIKEIESIKASRFLFADDNIGADPAYSRELFKALIPMKLRWACQMSTTIVKHPELIELAAKAGCHETLIGIESINEESLSLVNKGFNKVGGYREVFRRLKDVGILAQASLVFGLDGDNIGSLKRTIDTVLDWDANYIYIFVLTPLPGTRVYSRMEKEGRIIEKDWSLYDMTHPLFKFRDLTDEDVMETMWDTYQTFYSARNILKRAWRFRKQYIRFFPRDSVIEEVFFSFLIRNSVNMRKHPFSLGLLK